MKTLLLLIGKTTDRYMSEGVAEYVGRLSHYIDLRVKVLPDSNNTKSLTTEERKEREGQALLNEIEEKDDVVLLDERGEEYTSVEFARFLQKRYNMGRRRLVFVIGGAYGFSKAVQSRADAKVSLSRMTFSHQMVRLIFVEQLYRANTIIKGEHYHHE